MGGYDPIDSRDRDLEKQEAEARKKLARDLEIADLQWLMSSKKGRRIIWRLLDLSGCFRLSFDPNAMKMAFNEGNRNLGNQLLSEVMNLCPELYPVMLKERWNDRDGDGKQPK